MSETLEVKYKSKKQWIKAVILGFLIGLAVILPGISGATIAIIFGLYSKMIYSFGNILKEFKKCFLFLLPIVLGLALGFIIGFFFVQGVFEAYPFIVICLFAGLMIGSFPAVKDEIKGVKFNTKRVVFFVLGVLIPISIAVVSIFIQTASSEPIVASPLLMLGYFAIGFVVSLTQIIPGLSCSALLMALGQFGAILASIHFDYLINNPLVLVTLLLFALGFVVGIVVFSKLLNKLFDKARDTTYTMIVGLSLGSITTMFINPDMVNAYTAWNSVGAAFIDIGIGVALLVVGFVVSYMLVRYQRKIDAQAKESKNETEKQEETTKEQVEVVNETKETVDEKPKKTKKQSSKKE